jgi:hypothetical protein
VDHQPRAAPRLPDDLLLAEVGFANQESVFFRRGFHYRRLSQPLGGHKAGHHPAHILPIAEGLQVRQDGLILPTEAP